MIAAYVLFPMSKKSYYVLEAHVPRAEARQTLVFISGNEADIRAVLDQLAQDSLHLFFLLFYGMQMQLTAYENGKRKAAQNVLDHTTLVIKDKEIAGFEGDIRVVFDESQKPQALDDSGKVLDTKIDWENHDWAPIFEDSFEGQYDYGEDYEIRVELEFPALGGDLLQKGDEDSVTYHSLATQGEEEGTYGGEDAEQGEHLGDFEKLKEMGELW